MNKFVQDEQSNVWIAKSDQIFDDCIPKGTPVIKISQGDEFLFDRETIQNLINTMSPDLIDTFDISISKASENKWRVRFGNLPTGTTLIK